MQKPTLVVMAAGIGSRFGGLKQIEPIGPSGELIVDYAVYDAVNAGFGKVVFIIKKEIESLFKKKIGDRASRHIDVRYSYQLINDLPEGFKVPEGRTKPWGTAHAVLSCETEVDEPFAVINADDFYGRNSYKVLYHFLSKIESNDSSEYCNVGFILGNTLTEFGHVARGVCRVDASGRLSQITERTKIISSGQGAKYTEDGETWIDIPTDTVVSMNMWGFTPRIFEDIRRSFPKFLISNKDRIEKAEFYIPTLVDDLIKEGKAGVTVLQSEEKWFGVTYREDKNRVVEAIKNMTAAGIYPTPL